MAKKRGKSLPEDEAEPALVKNGWTIYAHPLLLDQLEKLMVKVKEEGDPKGSASKVLAWATRAMLDEIPLDPNAAMYRQGRTLGKGNTHWFRDKYAGRFRLFYRFDSRAKVIVFAWVNDEKSLRTRGAKNDAYAVFRGMIECGDPPNTWDDLVAQASTDAAKKRLRNVR